MSNIAMRACSRCGVEKPRDTANFLKIARSTDGLSYHCRECHKAYRRETKPTDNGNVTPIWQAWFDSQGIVADRITARHRRLRDPLGHAAKQMQKGLYGRTNGTDMFVAPELRTVRYIRNWLKNDPFCECCGVEFDPFPENGAAGDRSPSLDRFDLSMGYTLENTALVCWRCNNIKRNYVEADLRMVADWMEKRRSGQIKPIFAISWKSDNSENAA